VKLIGESLSLEEVQNYFNDEVKNLKADELELVKEERDMYKESIIQKDIDIKRKDDEIHK
jgi:hypothetical protein